MTGIERLMACAALKSVDRPGILPSYMDRFCALQTGLTFADVIERPDEASAAMRKVWDRLGGWGDAVYFASATNLYFISINCLMNILIPGKDIPRDVYWQIIEKPVIWREDYDVLVKKGWNAFLLEVLPRFWKISDEEMKIFGSHEAYHKSQGEKALVQHKKDTELWQKKGVDVFRGTSLSSPQMILSCGRSLTEYTLDLYEIPDKVEEALWAALPDLIQNAIRTSRVVGIPLVHITLERGSGQYYPLHFFERFEFPQLKKMVDEFTAHGITTLLHLDTDWSKNLPYFKEFPKGKVIASLDGTTNIFKAKKILGGHMCLMGDVPASLLVTGTTKEVEAYVSRLVEEVGDGGGFILGTGCSMPPNAKFENVKAMVDKGRSYGK